MATRTVKIDDVDGTEEDVRTVSLTVEGTTYAVDLGTANRDALAASLAPYIDAAAVVPTNGSRAPKRERKPASASGGGANTEAGAIRTWARANGFESVGERGRIPQNVRDAYAAASGAPAA